MYFEDLNCFRIFEGDKSIFRSVRLFPFSLSSCLGFTFREIVLFFLNGV